MDEVTLRRALGDGATWSILDSAYTGRSHLEAGLAIVGASAVALDPALPIATAALLGAMLSPGDDLTQPLLTGIVTDLGSDRSQAIGPNVVALFTGSELRSLVLSWALRLGHGDALLLFGAVTLVASGATTPLFRRSAVRA